VKKVFGVLGGGIALGEIAGIAVEGLNANAVKELARNGGKLTSKVQFLTKTGEVIELCEGMYGYAELNHKLGKHAHHKAMGINYEYDCEICNS
jgi:hypothetical protein